MLAEERFAAILPILQKQRTVTVLELTQALSISESTIRRNLVVLHRMGELEKVHGGTTLLHRGCGLYRTEVAARSEECVREKKRIAHYAVLLIRAYDSAYIGAGSTTPHMVEYLKEERAIYMTNGLEHGRRLTAQGFHTFLSAGESKSKTGAVVGLDAVFSLQKYNSDRAFFGTNGIAVDSSLITPDTSEVYVRVEVMKYVQKYYVLADSGKFGTCISITTADTSDTTIVTGRDAEEGYLEGADIIEVEEWSIQQH